MMSESSVVKPEVKVTKIGVYRTGKYKTKTGWSARNVKSLMVFEKDNILTFSIRQLISTINRFEHVAIFKLRAYKTKSGEQRFVFYHFSGTGMSTIRTTTPLKFYSILSTLVKSGKLPKVHQTKLLRVITAFVKKYNIKTKYLSKNFIHLLIQVCYPGTVNFNDQTLAKISTGRFFKSDPTRLVLGTQGKYSKKLIYQAIEICPSCTQSILRLAHYYRVHRSLDEAQRFLKEYIDLMSLPGNHYVYPRTRVFYEWDFYGSNNKSFANIPSKQLEFLKALPSTGPNSILHALQNHNITYFRDALGMLEEQSKDESFNLADIQYNSIIELHDALVEKQLATVGTKKKKKPQFEDYEFDVESPQIKINQQLADTFNNVDGMYREVLCPTKNKPLKWRFVFPSGTKELEQYAVQMHNCSFGYRDSIKSHTYILFCIQEMTSQELFKTRYMFGYTVYGKQWKRNEDTGKKYLPTDFDLYYDQSVSYCNNPIEQETSKLLKNIIKEIASSIDVFVKDESLLWMGACRYEDEVINQ
jgi:hypothetical protein